jgi:hypothetical protein
MASVEPDLSFSRDGVPLSEWLRRLVDDDRRTRLAAGEALEAMVFAVPSVHTPLEDVTELPDLARRAEAFEAEVKAALAAPAFPLPEFVRRLCAFRLYLHRDWLGRVDSAEALEGARDARTDRILDRLAATIQGDAPQALKAVAMARLGYVLAADFARGLADDEACYHGAEVTSRAGLASSRVIGLLGPELMAAPDALAMLLDEADQRREALPALARAGPSAAEFAPRLVRLLDERAGSAEYRPFDGAEALAAVGRGDPGVVDAMIRRLRHENPGVRAAAASVLACLGCELGGREREAIELLTPMLGREDEAFDAVRAFASVGRHVLEVRRRVMDRARPRPARMAPVWGLPEHLVDAVMWERGSALDSMRFFRDHADECVPVLIDAIDTFEEYDPDLSYEGSCGRVCGVLSELGPGAGAAALPLARRLNARDEDFPRAILQTLAAMGPAAREAVPLIEAFRRDRAGDEPLPDLDAGPVSEFDDLAGWAIQRIRGPSQG